MNISRAITAVCSRTIIYSGEVVFSDTKLFCLHESFHHFIFLLIENFDVDLNTFILPWHTASYDHLECEYPQTPSADDVFF